MRTPRQMPPFSVLLEQTQTPTSLIAKHLGVTERTVQRWAQTDRAPRAALAALFWETNAGRAAADCELWNWAQLQIFKADCLQRKNEKLRTQLDKLLALIEQRDAAANAPIYQIEGIPSLSTNGRLRTSHAAPREATRAHASGEDDQRFIQWHEEARKGRAGDAAH